MRTKFSLILSLLCLSLAFWACGDDGSSVASDDDYSTVSSSSVPDIDSSDVIPDPDRGSSSSDKTGSSSSVIPSEVEESSSSDKTDSSSSVIPSEVEESSSSVASTSSVESSSEDKTASSSSVTSSSSSVKKLAWEYLNPEISYGEMIDERDGQTYKTVEICNEDKSLCQTWMAENLNYADSVKTVSLKGASWCYAYRDANCDENGRLYTWAAAIDSAALANDADDLQTCGYGKTCDRLTTSALAEASMQGVCPSGWHLPSYAEWQTLLTAVGGSDNAGKALKSGSGWFSNGIGTDAYGFSALPAGFRYRGGFNFAGDGTYFWSSTERDSDYAYRMRLYYNDEDASLFYDDKSGGYSVRCLKN